MQNTSKLFVLFLVLAFVTLANGQQSRPYSEAKWTRYTIEKMGVSVELPSAPTGIGLGDLPEWFKSQVDDGQAASMSKIGKLEVQISAWTFKHNFYADVAMTGLAGGGGVSDGKFKLEFSQDAAPEQKNIIFEGEFFHYQGMYERKGIVVIRNQKSWMIQADYPKNDFEARSAAMRVIRSMRIEGTK